MVILNYKSGYSIFGIIFNSDGLIYNNTEAIYEYYDSEYLDDYKIIFTDNNDNTYDLESIDLDTYDLLVFDIDNTFIAYCDVIESSSSSSETNTAFTLIPYINSYGSLLEAIDYFSSKLNVDSWLNASWLEKAKSLQMATDILERLNWAGEVTTDEQGFQFPRYDDNSIPNIIKNASFEIAFSILDGVDIEKEQETLRISNETYADVKTSYNSLTVEHIQSGVPSKKAWDMIRPYLQSITHINLSRVN